MSRPSFDEIFLGLAVDLARRSTCSRAKVGCVIVSVDFHQVLAIGYNGGAAGLENDCESLEPGQCGHLHAEENAVIHCDAPRFVEKVVFTTMLPCKMCAKRLINLGGVKRVVYKIDYRLHDSLDLLNRAGIDCVFYGRPTEKDLLEANLTSTQQRCTELLEETRRLKGG
jgi:dCMP deaminase